VLQLLFKRLRFVAFMVLTGFPINLLYGFVLQDSFAFNFGCRWVVPQLRRFEPHFSHVEVCIANNALLSGYLWLAMIAVYTVLFCVACAVIYPRELIALSRKLVASEMVANGLTTPRPPWLFIPLVFVVFLGAHLFRGFEFSRSGVTRPPES
jgi:hypothetical protein